MHIHLDMLGGLAGDMFLAAALDADLIDKSNLEEALSSLGVGDIRIECERVVRGAIAGRHVTFTGWPPEAESDHRHLSTILEMLDDAELPPRVRRRAKAMFRTLGESESAVHDIPLEDVHFHECGALDSIFDFVSAAWILETTEATWSCGEVPLGTGTVETDHGTIPVPVPAAARLLEGFPTVQRGVEGEMVTPTGAAILKTLSGISPSLTRPDATLRATGFGAGTRQVPGVSNVVRMLVMEETADEKDQWQEEPTSRGLAPVAETAKTTETTETTETLEQIVRLECEIDDMTPELLADAEAALLEAGALDVVRQSVVMKKGRQGTRLTVLAAPEATDGLTRKIFETTTTFGIRVEPVERRILERHVEPVETPWGPVEVKFGSWRGRRMQATPEYEDCARVAREAGVTTGQVYREVLSAIERTPS